MRTSKIPSVLLGATLLVTAVACTEAPVSALSGRLAPPQTVDVGGVSRAAADGWARFVPSEPARTVAPPSSLPHAVSVVDTQQIHLDAALGEASSRGNVDVARFDGRVHLAVRSVAADGSTRIDIVSSEDEREFRRETSLGATGDLLSARLLSWNGALFAYASELSSEGGETKPHAVLAARLDKDGLWGDWRQLDLDAQVVWRAKVERGMPLLTSYALSERAYRFEEASMEVRLLTTSDGFDWRPLRSGQRVVYRGGGTEAAFSSDDDGHLYSVVKNEAGDESGFGSSLCAAEASDWARWDCVNDPKKYDSPTLFTHDAELYLVARRQLAGDGSYDGGHGFTLLRRTSNEARDLAAPQRCALWHFDRAHRRVDFVLDLPSRGNTCSAAVLPTTTDGEFAVYDQSSPLSGPDLSLQQGLSRPTVVYRHLLRFERAVH